MHDAVSSDKLIANHIITKMMVLKESDILRVLNATYIAERFFGRSKSWFSQKINNHMKNGEPVTFTPSEMATLKDALLTLSREIQEIAEKL